MTTGVTRTLHEAAATHGGLELSACRRSKLQNNAPGHHLHSSSFNASRSSCAAMNAFLGEKSMLADDAANGAISAAEAGCWPAFASAEFSSSRVAILGAVNSIPIACPSAA